MNMDERIKRINELYHKSKTTGLTKEEKEEQARLRKEYVQSVSANLRVQLDGITIERPDGSVEKLSRKKGKEKLRKEVLEKREALSVAEREKAALLLTERILGHQWFYRSDVVLGFAGYGSEIDTMEILKETLRIGKRLYLPKVLSEGEMQFYRVEALEDLTEGYHGILEPVESEDVFSYDEEDIDKTLLLMPGVAFDKERNRIGYGKGFYDRYLEKKEALQLRSIGVGFKCQSVDRVPTDPTDVKPYQVICV